MPRREDQVPRQENHVPRREDHALIQGRGHYVSDHRPDGCLHVAFLRSPEAHADILALETDDARPMPGVLALYTGADVAGLDGLPANALLPDLSPVPMSFLARDRVHAVGQPVAMVVADSALAAQDAAEAIFLDLAPRAPIPDMPVDGDMVAPPLWDSLPDNGVIRHGWQQGDMAVAAEGAAHRVSASVTHARLAPMTLEPRATCAELSEGGVLTLWLGTQAPHRARADLARILALDPAMVRVITPDVGGAFGMKAALYPEDVLTAWAALQLQRPLRWVASRGEDMQAASQGRGGRLRGHLQVAADGRFLGLEAAIDYPLGHWLPFSALAPIRNAGRVLPGPYDLQTLDIALRGWLTSTAPMGIYRGAGRPEAVTLMERLADEAARATGLDPLAIRRRNLIAHFPYDSATGETYDSANLVGLLDKAADKINYGALQDQLAVRRAAGELVGLGMALYIEPCGAGWESARLTLGADGRLRVASGSSSQGQGRQTTYARIAAAAMGLADDQVDVITGDSAQCPAGIGALASRSTAIGGSIVHQLAEVLRDRARQVAGRLLQADPDGVRFARDGVVAGDAKLGWADLVAAASADPATTLMVEDRFTTPAETWASGCCMLVLAIDRETGTPTVEQIVWADDAGRIINPLLAEGQLIGGLAQGLGEALMEQMLYDSDGQLLTGSLMDYAVPRADDMPPVTLVTQETPATTNPLGAKGVGEAGCIGIPGALLNAAHAALAPLGVCDLQMPLTPHRLWQAIQGADKPVHSESPLTQKGHDHAL